MREEWGRTHASKGSQGNDKKGGTSKGGCGNGSERDERSPTK